MRAKIISLSYHWQSYLHYFPVLVFALAMLIRIGLILTVDNYSSPAHYSEHVSIARNVLEGKGYRHDWYGLGAAGEGAFMPPVYVGLVLVSHLVFPAMPWLALEIFQALLSACTAAIIYFIGKDLFAEQVGVIASLMITVYPPALGYVLDIQSLIVEAFFVTLVVFAYVKWRKHATWKHALFFGLALGFAILSRSNVILLLPLLLIIMIIEHKRLGLVHFVLAMGVVILVLGPWGWRNYLVFHKFVLVSTNGGFTLFQGNNIYATGVAYLRQGDVLKQYPELARELVSYDEATRDKRLYQEAVTYMRTYPIETITRDLRKIVYFWWFKPGYIQGGIGSGYPWYFGLIYIASYALLLVFSVLGFILSFKEYRRNLLIFYALFLTQTAVALIFLAGIRHRGILEPLLVVLAAYAMAWIWQSRFSNVLTHFRGGEYPTHAVRRKGT